MPLRVLISGAGIAGPTLAWFLARAGAQVTVVEKASKFLATGQNIDINGPALTVLRRMGVYDEVRRLNTTEKGTRFIDSRGRPFGLMSVGEGKPSATSEFEILRGDLADILYKASRDHANVKYLFSTTVTDVLENHQDGRTVKVKLSSGAVEDYDLAVAADGQWSALRKMCFAPEEVVSVDKDMFIAYWTAPRTPSDNDYWNVYSALRRRIISIRPDPYGTIRAMMTLMPCDEAQRQLWRDTARSDVDSKKALVHREFADIGWESPRLLNAVNDATDFYLQHVQQIKLQKWSSGRVVCIGDAAYCPSPLTGMGTPLAILGAYILAGELAKLASGEHPSRAFEAMEARFKPHVEKIQRVSPFAPGVFHPKTNVGRHLLQMSLAALVKVMSMPFLAKRFNREGPNAEGNDDGFPLPSYSLLDTMVANSTESDDLGLGGIKSG